MNRLVLGLFLVGLAACSESASPPVTAVDAAVFADAAAAEDAAIDASIVEPDAAVTEPDAAVAMDAEVTDSGFVPSGDPFAIQPDTSEGLTNTSADLAAVLENGELETACARSEANPGDRRLRLLCGKYLFFYGTFDTAGVPTAIADFLLGNFPDHIGPGFEKLGMIPDPNSMNALPLGLAPSAPITGTDIQTYAFTCASCHFGRLPDGRYAVGAANHAYEYGKMNLAIALFPVVAARAASASEHDPDAVAAIQPMLDYMAATPGLRARLLLALLPLLGNAMVPAFPPEAERHYAHWKSGTMDFLIEPLPANDGVHTISKISSLFGIPQASEAAHAWLGWTGSTRDVEDFVDGFVLVGGGDPGAWPRSRVLPLAEYIYSLRSPAPPNALDVSVGESLFESTGCLECHAGPRGMGTVLYTYDEIGTDRALESWGDDGTGMPCCNLGAEPLTKKVKSPRLVGLWAQSRFLHNGSVESLEDLLCAGTTVRPTTSTIAYGDQGHEYGCDLDPEDKVELLRFLRAH